MPAVEFDHVAEAAHAAEIDPAMDAARLYLRSIAAGTHDAGGPTSGLPAVAQSTEQALQELRRAEAELEMVNQQLLSSPEGRRAAEKISQGRQANR